MCRNQRLIDFDLHVWQCWNCFNAQKTMYIFDENNFNPFWRSISWVIGPQIWPYVMLGPKNFTEIQNFSVLKCLSCTLYIFCGVNLFDYIFIHIGTHFSHNQGDIWMFLDFIGPFVWLGDQILGICSFLGKYVL